MADGEECGKDAGNGAFVLRLDQEHTLTIPPLYDALCASTEWPRLEELAVEEEMLTGPITTVTMAQFRDSVERRQRGRHWACYPLTPRTTETRSLLDCFHSANETPFAATQRKRTMANEPSARRKKRLMTKKGDDDGGDSDEAASEKSCKQARYRMTKILAEWETMDFMKVTPKQWKTLKQAAETHPGICAKVEEYGVKRNWVTMMKKDLPRGFKLRQSSVKRQVQDCRRLADLCRKEVRNDVIKNERELQKAPQGLKKLVREMLTFYRKLDKQNADLKKQADRAAAEKQKRDEEEREKKRQAQRLNFLLSQTELYSHFMSKKLGLPSEPADPSAEGMTLQQGVVSAGGCFL